MNELYSFVNKGAKIEVVTQGERCCKITWVMKNDSQKIPEVEN